MKVKMKMANGYKPKGYELMPIAGLIPYSKIMGEKIEANTPTRKKESLLDKILATSFIHAAEAILIYETARRVIQ